MVNSKIKKQVWVFVDPKELEVIDKVAKQENRTRSNYISCVAIKDAKKKVK